jgi:hypothetical protein
VDITGEYDGDDRSWEVTIRREAAVSNMICRHRERAIVGAVEKSNAGIGCEQGDDL